MTEVSLAGDWPVLGEIQEGRNKFVIEYDVSEREVRFLHYRGRSKKPTFYKVHQVGTDDEVNSTMVSIQSYLQSVEVPGQKQTSLLEKLNELQHLNMAQCEVIHFHSLAPNNSTNFNQLISEVERINALERLGPESFRSIPLFNISLVDEGDFQIRGVLNKKDDIVKLSIVRKGDEKEIKDFKVERVGEVYRFLSPKNELIFAIKPDFKDGGNGKVVLMTSKSSGVQNVHRSYFSLKKNGDSWKVKSYDPTPEMSGGLNGIPLIRFNVEHEPVLRVSGTEEFFKSLDEEELESLLELLKVATGDVSKISEVAKKEFARCMIDRSLVKKAENSGELTETERKMCLLVAELEASHENEKLKAATYFEKYFDSSVTLNESVKAVSDELRICLGESQGLNQQNDIIIYDYDYIGRFRSKVREHHQKCLREVQSFVVEESIKEEIRTDSTIKDVIPNGTVFEDFLNQVIEKGYKGCLKKKEGKFEECRDFSSLYKGSIVFTADVTHRFWQKNERNEANIKTHDGLISGYRACLSRVYDELMDEEFNLTKAEADQNKCGTDLILGLGSDENAYSYEKILTEIEFFNGQNISLNDEQKKVADEKYKECYEKSVADLGSSLEQFESIKYNCAVEAAKELIPNLYAEFLAEDLDEYIWDEKQKETLIKYTERLAKRRISDLNSPANISEALEKEVPAILAKALNGVVDGIMVGNFTDEDNFLFNREAQKELEKKIFFLIGGNSNKPMSYEFKRFVLKQVEKDGIEGARLQASSFLKDFVKAAMPFIAIKEVGDEVFSKEDRESIARVVDNEIQKCLDEYKPDSPISFEKVYAFCEKKKYGLTQFLLAKRDFETLTSHHFKLATDEGNRILTPVHYMKGCIDDLATQNLEMDQYEKRVSACINLAKIKISNNIDKERVKKFRPYMKDHRGGEERYAAQTSAYCHVITFAKITKELDDPAISRRIHDHNGGVVRGMLTSGNLIFKDAGLLEAIGNSEVLNDEWFDKNLQECRDNTHQYLISGLKHHLISLIPASLTLNTNRVGQTNKEVLESFLDGELLDQLLKLKVQKGDKGGELNTAEKDPMQKVVTSTLTLDALSNFMKILGGYISDGFIYDKDKMKTELVIFREELKRALKWVNNQERPIRLAELGDFFTESTFADHLSQAMISEMVRDNFMDFVRDMEQNELRAARQGSGHSSSAIRSKFKKIREHVVKMTSYYDFRHIIRPKSIKGDRLLKMIKENYLLPTLIGDEVSTYTKNKIKNDVANMILGDNTEGGFAELFVREVAQMELDKREKSHWGITKFFFYDNDDFDWSALRKTDSGKKAMEYYGREVLLPKMLGKDLTTYEENLRMERFRKILNDAISENE